MVSAEDMKKMKAEIDRLTGTIKTLQYGSANTVNMSTAIATASASAKSSAAKAAKEAEEALKLELEKLRN